MGRAWRIEYDGALHHLVSRSDRVQTLIIDWNDWQ